MNNDELKSNLLSAKHWLRLVFMLLFAALLQVASIIMWVLVLLQFIFSLITGQDNVNLRKFGYSLSTYIYQTLKFLTYSSEEKPFPFADWPEGEEEVPVAEVVEVVVKPRVRTAKIKAATPKEDTDSHGDS
jgi:hypothetical protein